MVANQYPSSLVAVQSGRAREPDGYLFIARLALVIKPLPVPGTEACTSHPARKSGSALPLSHAAKQASDGQLARASDLSVSPGLLRQPSQQLKSPKKPEASRHGPGVPPSAVAAALGWADPDARLGSHGGRYPRRTVFSSHGRDRLLASQLSRCATESLRPSATNSSRRSASVEIGRR